MSADNWNVVILGHWNPAILTPAGIAKRLFGVGPEIPVDIQVPLNGLGPIKVRHGEVVVSPESTRLVVEAVKPTYEDLDKARDIAVRAMESLPETPLMASGFNIRLRLPEPPDSVLSLLAVQLDDALSREGFIIQGRSVQRALKWREGMLNLNLKLDAEGSLVIEFNFHRSSERWQDLATWLRSPRAEIEGTVGNLLRMLGLSPPGDAA